MRIPFLRAIFNKGAVPIIWDLKRDPNLENYPSDLRLLRV